MNFEAEVGHGLLYSLPISIILGWLIGLAYARAYRGILLSASFVHTVVVTVPLVTVSVFVVHSASAMQFSYAGQALAFAFVGLLGLIRFRTVIRDTREFTFIFLAIVTGACLGSGLLVVAISECSTLLTLLLLLEYFGFGSPNAPSLRVTVTGVAGQLLEYQKILHSISSRVEPVSIEATSDNQATYSFEIIARTGEDLASAAAALRTVPQTSEISVVRVQRAAKGD